MNGNLGHLLIHTDKPSPKLAVLTAQVRQIDWLELGRGGHRRAVFDAAMWEWRVP
jgi:hypothetical protein